MIRRRQKGKTRGLRTNPRRAEVSGSALTDSTLTEALASDPGYTRLKGISEDSSMDIMDREQTIGFLGQHVKTEMLMKHLLTVEASMRGYARKYGEDEDRWVSPGCFTTSTGKFALFRRIIPPLAQRFCGIRVIPRISFARC